MRQQLLERHIFGHYSSSWCYEHRRPNLIESQDHNIISTSAGASISSSTAYALSRFKINFVCSLPFHRGSRALKVEITSKLDQYFHAVSPSISSFASDRRRFRHI